MTRRVAIIGGGVSGLVATKSCLDEGLEPTCFERRDALGGLWVFDDKVTDSLSCCMWSTMTNTSKEMSCFSDFLMPKEFPNFLHNTEALDYLKGYAKHFELDRYFCLNTDVVMVQRAEDFASTGRWIVKSQNLNTGETKTEVFDAVIVCSGHHVQKHIPRYPGLDEFKGQILHSHDYRKSLDFTGKRVLVVGLGNSGGDIASEIGLVGKVTVSTRRGVWVVRRTLGRGLPWDASMHTRLGVLLQKLLPFSWVQTLLAADLSATLDHDMYGLTSASLPKGFAPFVSDDLADRIVCGRVKVKGDVKRFSASGVEFQDGTSEHADAVVFATGYHIRFPFIEKEVIEIKDNIMPLYKRMFLPDLDQQTLAFIGFFNANGSLWPICELQSRIVARVLSGAMKLPSRKAMTDDIKKMEEERAKIFPDTLRHTVEVDFVPFLDELAEMLGCKPDIRRLLLTDPKLCLSVLCGPCVPAQYRLHGPGQWPGARQAVLTVMDRVRFPLQTRRLPSGVPENVEWVRRFFHPSKSWIMFLYLVIFCLLLCTVL